MFGGGGGMFGGGGSGAGGQWNATGAATKFAGIPPEMEARVKFLVDKEPDFDLEHVPFTQVYDDDQKPFTLRRFLAPKRWAIAGVLALIAMEVFCQQYGPRLVANAVNEGIVPVIEGGTGHFDVVVRNSIFYFLLLIGAILIGAARINWSGRIGEELLYRLRVRVFAQVQRLSLDYFTDEKAGRIMTRVTSDIEAIQVLFQQGLVNMVLQVFTVVFVVWQLFAMNVTLALWVTLGVVPLLTALTWWFRSSSDFGYLAVRDWIAAVIADLAENLSGTRVVAAHNRQRYNVVKHDNIVGSYRAASMYTGNVAGTYGPGAMGIGVLGQALVLLIGGRMVIDGKLSLGDFTAFNLYLNRFFQPIQQLAQLYNVYQQGNAGVVKLRELFHTRPAVREKADAQPLPSIEGEISLEDVTFGYTPDALVLDHVDLTIAKGETFALVGPTGAGKSTIAKLLTRFYDPISGRVLVDGHDIADVTLHSLRRQLGIVPQESFLFAGTIGDNIAFAKPDASREELLAACDAVGIRDLIDALPEGLDTPCHERGVTLSSGERQLIALARAFLASPRVLILDEATSSLDLATERMVERALDVLLEGRTAVLIAHRLNTAMRADRIAVVENGHLAEVGSHDDLVARGGRYAEMFAAWRQTHHDGAAAPNGSFPAPQSGNQSGNGSADTTGS
jgi:ATP-binding cassette subfamily B protein